MANYVLDPTGKLKAAYDKCKGYAGYFQSWEELNKVLARNDTVYLADGHIARRPFRSVLGDCYVVSMCSCKDPKPYRPKGITGMLYLPGTCTVCELPIEEK